ncbi:MAG: sigma-70 family RNA polymerase sigma factor [Oscillospiraceae bacterium]|nr:sigma-70 family RNA polymerase sigma factor [Oscillospiraceae bacterium]
MIELKIRSLLKTDTKQGERLLFDEYYNYVYTIVYQKLCNIASREDIEDCVIECFVKIFMYINPDYEGSLKAYIGTVAKHEAINIGKQLQAKSKKQIFLEEQDFNNISSEENIETFTEQSEQTRILMHCISELGEPDASIIIQKFFYNRNSIEISKIIKLNPVAVRVRCSRALKRLKTMLLKKKITL